MAQPYSRDPAFGTREQDWPDPDVDSDTESGADAIRRSEDAMHATIDRSIRQRCPPHPARDAIPQSLYVKAELRQDDLTPDERALLLSRGDVVGKALARPDSLTAEEMHEVLGWPAPDAVRASVQRATGGAHSHPIELYAKGMDALGRGEALETAMSEAEIGLLARGFRDADPGGFPVGPPMMAGLGGPGAGEAMALVARRMGLELAVFRAAAVYESGKIGRRLGLGSGAGLGAPAAGSAPAGRHPADIIGAMLALHRDHELGNVTDEEVAARNAEFDAALRAASSRSSLLNAGAGHAAFSVPQPFAQTDVSGSARWPARVQPRDPVALFREDRHVSSFDAMQAWYALSEEEKEAYHVRSETLRREAWGFGPE